MTDDLAGDRAGDRAGDPNRSGAATAGDPNRSGAATAGGPTGDGPDYRRELYAAVGLTVIGAGGQLWIANRAWLSVRVARQPPFGPLSLGVSDRHLNGSVPAMALVGLLAAALVLFSGRLVRRSLGLLLIVVGAWVGANAIRFLASDSYLRRDLVGSRAGLASSVSTVSRHDGWAWASVVCSLLILGAAAILSRRAGRWPGGLSRRYAAPAEAAAAPDPWRQLDRGEDPTIHNG